MTEIVIPEYITHVELSKSRKAKYYKRGQATPKKYEKYKKYDLQGRLLDEKGEPIIANPRIAGTPKLMKINGQQLYSGNMNPLVRSKVVNKIKEFFADYIPAGMQVQVPTRLEADLYAPLAAKNWDLDNQWIYHKCFIDALVAKSVLPDDNVMFVTQAPGFLYYPVTEPEERQLIYRLIPEDRQVILEHEAYKAVHFPQDDSGETLEF